MAGKVNRKPNPIDDVLAAAAAAEPTKRPRMFDEPDMAPMRDLAKAFAEKKARGEIRSGYNWLTKRGRDMLNARLQAEGKPLIRKFHPNTIMDYIRDTWPDLAKKTGLARE